MSTRTLRILTWLLVGTIAAIAFAVSFEAISQYAVQVGAFPRSLRYCAPLLVDAFTVAAGLVILARARDGVRAVYAWSLVAVASAVSIALNVAHAPHALAAQLVAWQRPQGRPAGGDPGRLVRVEDDRVAVAQARVPHAGRSPPLLTDGGLCRQEPLRGVHALGAKPRRQGHVLALGRGVPELAGLEWGWGAAGGGARGRVEDRRGRWGRPAGAAWQQPGGQRHR